MGHSRPICNGCVMSASTPKAFESLGYDNHRDGPDLPIGA
jgi:hypothetical protein